jgi:alpha-ketoglutarate-dependent taurine dioxygenase
MSRDTLTRLQTTEIAPQIGSRVHAEKSTLLGGWHAAEILDLLEMRGVLVFPGIGFTDNEQVAFTETLGVVAREQQGGDIYQVTLEEGAHASVEYLKATFFWHFDGYGAPAPVRASLLSAKVLSSTGGDTQFCNTYAAYAALSAEEQGALEPLRAVHAMAATQLDVHPEPSHADWIEWMQRGRKELPLVWKHRSGRKSLVIGNSAHHIVGMDPLEGQGLLIRLRDWATQPAFTYTHHWAVGDLVMWDNTGTLHRATPYAADSGRLLHRTKLEGEEPIA